MQISTPRSGEDGDAPHHYLSRWYENEAAGQLMNMVHLVQLLIERGAEVNDEITNWWETALLCLCSRYVLKEDLLVIVNFLIQNGADANARNKYRRTRLLTRRTSWGTMGHRPALHKKWVNVEDVWMCMVRPYFIILAFHTNMTTTKETYLLKSIVCLFFKQGPIFMWKMSMVKHRLL